ncbi:alpha/beta fold hydrolase [Nocardioides cavernae]|uniref:alpha/beta fold hydrolase n=1 Tax=Nocardioides TaxID=1839 RepID=UPI000A8C92A4|nr:MULTISPECIES: alpha/beta fold hydrolase [Nocardioides]MCK9824450.1 alpha/beta fold hydrolase [Nocardioides cavernae]
MTATDAPRLLLRELSQRDTHTIQALLEADADYARRVTGAPASPHAAVDLLEERPPGLPAEHKVVLGAYDDTGDLVAVIDVLRGWPDAHTAHIGLLQTHPDHQRRGIGRRTHDLLLDWVARWPEIQRLRATIVATNAPFADPFWTTMGYRPGETATPYLAGEQPTTALAWTRDLPNSPSPERFADVGDVTLCYQTFGDPASPTMLLIMGLGFQLVHWPDAFCRQLADQGLHVVRFDNRDAGRSTHLPGGTYTLDDMADDAVGLLDHLGVATAHVVGASLGAMVAQLMAIRHPDRVASLASLMSTSGQRGKGRTSPLIFRHLLARRPRTEEEAVERRVRIFRAVGSTGLAQDLDELRRATVEAFRRDPDARDGRRRQHRAVRTASDRTRALARLDVPTVVIHGSADPMCHPSGGRATAAAIPGARLEIIEGMGHDLPPAAWPRIITALAHNARTADPQPGGSR